MAFPKFPLKIAIAMGLSLVSGAAYEQSNTKPAKADNSAENKAGSQGATADSQKMNAADTALAAKVRKAIVADKSLSTYGHNVKIIVQNGVVTLKGPVRSEDERASITTTATSVVGDDGKIMNQMTVAPPKQ